jgi:hypothetical protein
MAADEAALARCALPTAFAKIPAGGAFGASKLKKHEQSKKFREISRKNLR